jgi:hypothetical protein
MQVRIDPDVAKEIKRLAKVNFRSKSKEVSSRLRMQLWPEKFFDPVSYRGEYVWHHAKDSASTKP